MEVAIKKKKKSLCRVSGLEGAASKPGRGKREVGEDSRVIKGIWHITVDLSFSSLKDKWQSDCHFITAKLRASVQPNR